MLFHACLSSHTIEQESFTAYLQPVQHGSVKATHSNKSFSVGSCILFTSAVNTVFCIAHFLSHKPAQCTLKFEIITCTNILVHFSTVKEIFEAQARKRSNIQVSFSLYNRHCENGKGRNFRVMSIAGHNPKPLLYPAKTTNDVNSKDDVCELSVT